MDGQADAKAEIEIGGGVWKSPAGKPLRLDSGARLEPLEVAYKTYGRLNEAKSNAVLVCHALTGDQHHYARYTCTDPTPPPDDAAATAEPFAPELVTCGGGGAFLASTHHLPERLSIALRPWPSGSGAIVGYRRATAYPDVATSLAIGRSRFLSAAWRNGPTPIKRNSAPCRRFAPGCTQVRS